VKTIKGFIYNKAGTPAEYTRAEWREQIARVTEGGGWVRQEFGETFAHGPDGLIALEIYAQGIVPRRAA
jgi:hypothetical protein